MNFSGSVEIDQTTKKRPDMVINKISLGKGAIDISSDDEFGLSLERNNNSSNKFDAAVSKRMNIMHRIMRIVTYVSKKLRAVTHEMVQERWGMYSSVSKNIVERTTQRGIRVLCPHMLFINCIRTNDRMLQYKRLLCNVLTDTLISGTASKRGNKYSWFFATYFGWVQGYPMKTKGNAHEALLLLFQWKGVPDHPILDRSKEQDLVLFKKKCSQAGCLLKRK